MLALCVATAVATPAEAHHHRASMTSLIRHMRFSGAWSATVVKAPEKVKAQRAQAAACTDVAADPAVTDPAVVRASVLCLLNVQRADHGLAPLRGDDQLRSAGQGLAEDMVRRHFFDHVSPGGGTMTDRVSATGYVPTRLAWTLGETIGWGTGALATPTGIVDAFMHSPPHREIILTPGFRDVGIGMTTGVPVLDLDAAGATYALDFGWTGTPQER